MGIRGRPLAHSVPAPARSWLRRSQTSERVAHPSAGLAGLWARALLAPAPPPRLPAPPRGWSCRAGPLNPGCTGGRLLGAGGSAAGRSAPSTARGRGGATGRVRWGGGRDSCREATRTHTLTHRLTHTGPPALSRSHPARCCFAAPGPAAPTRRAIGKIKGCSERLLPFISPRRERDGSHRSPNDTLPFPAQGQPACLPRPGVLYSPDSGPWLSPCLSQQLRVTGCEHPAHSKVSQEAGLAVPGRPGPSQPPQGEVASVRGRFFSPRASYFLHGLQVPEPECTCRRRPPSPGTCPPHGAGPGENGCPGWSFSKAIWAGDCPCAHRK